MSHLRVIGDGGNGSDVPPTSRDFLRRCADLLPELDDARAVLAQGITNDDVELALRAARKLLAVGLLFGDLARKIGADL